MRFGLTEEQEQVLISLLERKLSSGTVLVYGSRAKGNYTQRSDLDLVIKGMNSCSSSIIEDVRDEISESDFPYLVDIQCYEKIQNLALKDHIDRVGLILFSKKTQQL